MAGISKDKAIKMFDIPIEYTPVTKIALGYKKEDDEKPEKGRKTVKEIVFENYFGH